MASSAGDVEPTRLDRVEVERHKMVERQRSHDALAVIEAEQLRQHALDQELRDVQHQIKQAESAASAAVALQAASPKVAYASPKGASLRSAPPKAASPKAASPKAASPRSAPQPQPQPEPEPEPQPHTAPHIAPHTAVVRRVARRQRLKKRPLRVRTPTDILKEQVASTPALQYWWPDGSLCGVHAIDSSEDPVVRIQSSARFPTGASHRQGQRQSMEDRSVVYGQLQGRQDMDLFAVFDGHGSRGEADFAAAYLPACLMHELEKAPAGDVHGLMCSALRQTSNAMRGQGQGMTTGTTAVVAVIADSQLHVANVGDSNAVLSFADGSARTLTVEHKPNLPSERARIEALDGGLVTVSQRNGIARVQGQLAVSRALGDFHLEPYVTSEPSTVTVDLTSAEGNGPEYLILACDGVWDVYDARGAAMEVRRSVHHAQRKVAKMDHRRTRVHKDGGNATMDYAAGVLCDRSLNRGSTDNISVIVIDLRRLGTEQPTDCNTRIREPEPEPEPEADPTQAHLELQSEEPAGPLKFSATSPAGCSPIKSPAGQSQQLGVFSPGRLPYPISGVHDNGAVEVGWKVTGDTSPDKSPDDFSSRSPGAMQSPGKSPTCVKGSRGGGGRRGAAPMNMVLHTNTLQGMDSCPL